MLPKVCSTFMFFMCYVSHGLDITGQGRPLLNARRRLSESKEKAGPNLLKPEETQNSFNHTFPGCWLGGKFYMVGDRWSPSIEPLGIVHCVKCQCAQIIKKTVIQLNGKVICRNIKTDCPSVKCDFPLLRPNTCCRVCPGKEPFFEDQFGPEQTDITGTTPSFGGHNTMKNFDMTALLTGEAQGLRKQVKTRAVAAVHVTNIRNNSFNYVIRFTRLKSPVFLRFTDDYGRILMEKKVPQQNSRSGHLSGTWSDVPLSYMQYILQELVFVTISTSRHKSGEISGRLRANSVASKATFESVMSSPTPRGIGALIQVIFDDIKSIGTYVIQLRGLKYFYQELKRCNFEMWLKNKSNALKVLLYGKWLSEFETSSFNLYYQGFAESIVTDDSEFFVTFEKDTEIMHQLLLRISEANLVGKISFDKQTSKQIARGRLRVRVTSRSGDTMIGLLRPRLQRFDLIAEFHRDSRSLNVTGFVALALEENGSIRYKIVADGMNGTQSIDVSLQRLSSPKKRWKTFATLPKTPELHTNQQVTMAGFYKKVRALDTLALLENRLRLEVKVGQDDAVIASSFKTIKSKSVDIFTASHAVLRSDTCLESVLVLYHITPYCSFTYHMVSPNMTSLPSTTSALGLDDRYSFSVGWTSDMPDGSISNIPEKLFRSLRRGDAKLTLRTSYGQCDQLTSQRITVPNNCLTLTGQSGEENNEAENNNNGVYRCLYKERFYTHGETWAPADHSGCVTCRCDKGRVFCDEMPCPATNCKYPRTITAECCPFCEEDNETERKVPGSCFYHGDKRWHPVGTFWYPYVPPFGYSKCALCNCEANTLQVNCSRLPCPPLHCPQFQRVRLNKDDCCQVCKEGNLRAVSPTITKRKDCKFGTSVYKHGHKWHPWLTPFGEMKCYVCSCKNGKSRCRKLRCEKLGCEHMHHPAGRCCPVCLDSTKTNDRDIVKDRLLLRSRRSG